VAEFDARHPDGADYVIVPAMSRDDDPAVLEWLKSQASKGAIVIGVCAGAKVVGEAGLLDGKRATTHWYFIKELRKEHPAVRYVEDRRFVVDQGVATTTGITASMPSLTLIEATDRVATTWPAERRLPAIGGLQPAKALDEALEAIASHYGAGTANVVAMQLEYPWQRVSR
jgi:putative intracellular protease/amidase